jgi:hypothetical protein
MEVTIKFGFLQVTVLQLSILDMKSLSENSSAQVTEE